MSPTTWNETLSHTKSGTLVHRQTMLSVKESCSSKLNGSPSPIDYQHLLQESSLIPHLLSPIKKIERVLELGTNRGDKRNKRTSANFGMREPTLW